LVWRADEFELNNWLFVPQSVRLYQAEVKGVAALMISVPVGWAFRTSLSAATATRRFCSPPSATRVRLFRRCRCSSMLLALTSSII